MTDLLRRIHESMRSMVLAHGCYESVNALVEARFGRRIGKGAISKRMSGELPWTLEEVIALDEASGRWLVTDILMRHRAEVGAAPMAHVDLISAAGVVNKEFGEGMAATMQVLATQTPADRAKAAVEVREAIEAMTRVLRALEGN